MPRKFLKRYSPSPKTIRENKTLACLGDSIHQPNLWHLNRHSVSRAFAIGLFCTWLPIPLQTLLAAFLAIFYRANLPISVALVFVTNPITIPPMFYFSYKLGSWMLGMTPEPIDMNISWEWFTSSVSQAWQPLLFGSLTMAIVSSIIGFFVIRLAWRNNIKKRWQDRRKKREAKRTKRAMERKIQKMIQEQQK